MYEVGSEINAIILTITNIQNVLMVKTLKSC